MRIIAGELKGRRLATLADSRIRPTSEKVKEAIFSMIASYLDDAVVIDLFSGTGNLGLEAISRGANLVFFGDKSHKSMELIRKNIQYCRVEKNSITILGDWKQILKKISKPADVIFLDPPYEEGLLKDCIETIQTISLLNEGGIIIAEHGYRQILPNTVGSLIKTKEKKYGTIVVSFYSQQVED